MGIGTSVGKVNLVTSRIASNLRLSSMQSFFLGIVRVAFSHSNKLGTSPSIFFLGFLVLTEQDLQFRVS